MGMQDFLGFVKRSLLFVSVSLQESNGGVGGRVEVRILVLLIELFVRLRLKLYLRLVPKSKLE